MLRRLRILHCLRAPVGGLFRHVIDLADGQAGLGHAVGILCGSITGNPLAAASLATIAGRLELGVTELAINRRPRLTDLSNWRVAHDLAHRLDLDVLHGHGAKGGALARLAGWSLRRRGRRVTTVYTPHGGSLHFDPGTLRGTAVLSLERVLERMTGAILFESAYAQRMFAERVGPPATTQAVIMNGLRPEDFNASAPNADAADFLFVGELRHLKGVDVLLKALAEINANRRTRAVIVGAGPDAASFRTMAKNLELDALTEFASAMPARDAFRLGRCLVVPSRAESLPYIVLEAAAAGLPLIASNVGGIPEIVAGTSARLVPHDDSEALATAMLDALNDPASMKTHAMELKRAVAERFTVAGMTSAVLQSYSGLVAP